MSDINIFDIQRFSINDGPGIRTTVFFKGCGMFCKWCANPESQKACRQLMYFENKCVGCRTCIKVCPQGAVSFIGGKIVFDRKKCDCCGTCVNACIQEALCISGKTMSSEAVANVALRDMDYYTESGGGVTFTGGEPMLQPFGLKEISSLVKSYGIHTALETAADVPKDIFTEAIENIDLILADYKSADKEKLVGYTGGNLEQIQGNIKAACMLGKDVIARIPVIPSFNFDDESMAEIFKSLSKIGVTKADLLPYHIMGKKKYESLGMVYPFENHKKSLKKEDLEKFRELGKTYNIQTAISGK